MSVENLIGELHEHDFSIPWRGYLMCSNEFCGEAVTFLHQPLTEEQVEALRIQIMNEYSR